MPAQFKPVKVHTLNWNWVNSLSGICTQNKDFLKLLQKSRNDYKLFIYPSSFEEGLELAKSMDLYGITISTDKISKTQIDEAHENGLFVAIWNTTTKKKNNEAISKNPDYIQTDKVEYLVNLLK